MYAYHMKIIPTPLDGLCVIEPQVFPDARGFFMKIWNTDAFRLAGLPGEFAEENQSRSRRGVVRGLHFQWDRPLGKLIRVLRGRAYMAGVDIRKKSPTRGQWFGAEFTGENRLMMYAPPGIATGFLSLEDPTEIQYNYSVPHNPGGEGVISWNDPVIGVSWPLEGPPALSVRDAGAQSLDAWLARPESDYF
jgi:dTDP-4-dehydrorhamnose 3,5-epimerase